MSHKNNVNPDYYKQAGRDRQGDEVQPELEKAKLTRTVRRRTRRKRPRP